MSKPRRTTTLLTRDHPSERIRVPFIEIQGATDGPTLTLCAGIHACEYAGIQAAVTLGKTIDPAQLKGRLRIITVANVPGFLGRTEGLCPVDGGHLGRSFPGDPAGSYTMALADLIWQQVGRHTDYLIDMHGGDIFEVLIPFVSLTRSPDPDLTARCLELARIYGLGWILEFKSRARPQDPNLSLVRMALDSGIPAFLTESGGQGVLRSEDAERHVRGVRNVMHAIGMINDPPPPAGPIREMYGDFWRIEDEGLIYPSLRLGDFVAAGQPMGTITDWFGEPITPLCAPADGWITAIVTTPAARKGAIIYQVGVTD